MDITTITITYELRQNLGDYSGVKLAATMTAAVEEGEDPEQVRTILLEQARRQVQGAVDDALEQNGREVIYSTAPLYRVYQSDVRKCVVLLPNGLEPPKEATWKDQDYWQSVGEPRRMRIGKAVDVWTRAGMETGFDVVDCRRAMSEDDPDLDAIPPLLDPGPEPLWYSKNLQRMLEAMGIDPALWDELAGLEHVTAEFLEQVYQESRWNGRIARSDRMEVIRSGVLPAPEPEPEDESDEVEFDDEEDGEEDDSF